MSRSQKSIQSTHATQPVRRVRHRPVTPTRTLAEVMADGGRADHVQFRWSDGDDVTAPAGDLLEQALVQGACVGDEASLEVLCRREWLGVHRKVADRVADPVEVEEVTEEIFSRGIADLSRFCRGDVPFGAFLAQITQATLAERSRRSPQPPVRATGAVPGSGDGTGVAARGEVVVLAAQERTPLLRALGRLQPRYREVLRMRLIDGYTTGEVGARQGRSVDAVRRAQAEAFLALRAQLLVGAAQ